MPLENVVEGYVMAEKYSRGFSRRFTLPEEDHKSIGALGRTTIDSCRCLHKRKSLGRMQAHLDRKEATKLRVEVFYAERSKARGDFIDYQSHTIPNKDHEGPFNRRLHQIVWIDQGAPMIIKPLISLRDEIL